MIVELKMNDNDSLSAKDFLILPGIENDVFTHMPRVTKEIRLY